MKVTPNGEGPGYFVDNGSDHQIVWLNQPDNSWPHALNWNHAACSCGGKDVTPDRTCKHIVAVREFKEEE